MNFSRINKSFKRFIDQDKHFSEKEQQYILSAFNHRKNHKAFYLSIILLVWGFIGAIIESLLVGGGVIWGVMGDISIVHFLPVLIFFLLSFFAKIIFSLIYMSEYLLIRHSLCCGIPYVGGALLLGIILKKDKLFLKGILHYIKYLKKHIFKFVYHFFKSNKEDYF